EAIAAACRDPKTGRLRATQLPVIEQRLFDRPGNADALELVLSAAATGAGREAIPLRVHMFVRTVRGLWACANPDCDQVEPEYQWEGRRIGRLFSRPASTCPCGGRVLEVLYCFDCGDVSLGGYIVETVEGEPPARVLGPNA